MSYHQMLRSLVVSVLVLDAFAELPSGGNITSGSGQLSQSGNSLPVYQGSDKLSIDRAE